MSDKSIDELVAVVDTWNVQKVSAREFNSKDMRRFIETMNNRTRHLISLIGRQDPDFFMGLVELATNASTLTTPGARIYGDGQDRTNL